MTCSKGCCDTQRTHYKSIGLLGFPHQQTLSERKLSMDMAAYKRLVNDGLQPPTVDGAYVIERSARDEREVELGRPVDALTKQALTEAGM